MFSKQGIDELISRRVSRKLDHPTEVKKYSYLHEMTHYISALSRGKAILYQSPGQKLVDEGCTNYFTQLFSREIEIKVNGKRRIDFGMFEEYRQFVCLAFFIDELSGEKLFSTYLKREHYDLVKNTLEKVRPGLYDEVLTKIETGEDIEKFICKEIGKINSELADRWDKDISKKWEK